MVRRALGTLLAVLVVAAPWSLAVASLDPTAAARTFDALVELFRREYWDADHVDWDVWASEHRERVLESGSREAFDRALRRMVAALADDHSTWTGLPPRGAPPGGGSSDPAFLPDPPPRLGVQFVFVVGRGLVVERVFPSTPAAEVGLQRGDVVVAVDGESIADRRGLADANGVLVAGLESGGVRLEVERRRARLTIDVTAAPIEFTDVARAPFGALLDATTGYLAVPSFNFEGVGGLAHARLRELADAGAVNLVLDLRGNLGGRLVELGLVLGAFTEGDWAEAVSRGRVAWRARFERTAGEGVALLVETDGTLLAEARVPDPIRWRGPVVVIVGAENASAGEIAALALQDHGVARVVGERTPGNVEALRGFSLPDGSRVLIAVANLRGARGLAYDAGVVPDVTARATVLDLSRGVDPALAEARRLLGALPFTPDRHF